MPSIISADLEIVGDLNSRGDVQIDGSVEGNIRSRSLTVGEGARVKGVLMAEDVRIYGAVLGEVKANSVMLAKTAEVEGDVVHQSISMEAGAALAGKLSQLDKAIDAGGRPAAVAAAERSGAPASAEKAGQRSDGSGPGSTPHPPKPPAA